MFDIGWTEMLVVAVIAIVFVGPKELPGMLRTFGQVIKKVKGMAGEFQGQFNEALKEAELDGLKDTIDDVRSLDPTKAIKDKLNPLKDDIEKSSATPDAKVKDLSPAEIEAQIAKDHAEHKAKQKEEIEAGFAAASERAKASTQNASGTNAVPGFSSEPDAPIVTAEQTPLRELEKTVAAPKAKSVKKVATKAPKKSAAKPKAKSKAAAKPKAKPKAGAK